MQNYNGSVARDAVSCRKPTRVAPEGQWVAGFDGKGRPISRAVGYMIPCATNSDCHSRCPSAHPLHGTPYTCMKNFHLYDYFETTEDGNYFRQMENGDRFDPDPQESAITGEWGLCVVRPCNTLLPARCPERVCLPWHRTRTTITSSRAS